ncbi:MAG TPA: tetratricopeptide repeat protein, partial [Kofleriaceae bacterium]
MFEGGSATSRRLPFHFQAHGGVGRLTLADLAVGPVAIDKLELEVSDLGTDPGAAPAERFQRRRTILRGLAVRIAQPALDERIAQIRKQLGAVGITQVSARLADGYVSVRARVADGLAAADLSFHVELVSAGTQLRALASAIRVHGHLPTPGPVIADRLLVALTAADGAGDAARSAERPYSRGLCDVELDLIAALLWQVLPPSGWRLPAVSEIELTHIRLARSAIEVGYGPAGSRTGELGVRKHTQQLAAAHDLMHSVDDQLRSGHHEDAMRGYRALLASGGPDQPMLLERILALAAARPAWFFDGLELARQALGRWPRFAPAHAALASITLAQGDAREAARHLEDGARLAGAGGDDDQAALAALAAARLLRVLDPRAATQLYQLALEHDPGSNEAADSLADRLADEQRWSELVRLVRTRIAAADVARAVQLHLRLADVFVHQLGDPAAAQRELAAARERAPDDPAVHEMTATILGTDDRDGAAAAWREVARLAEQRGDHRTCARAWARLGELLASAGDAATGGAEDAWRRALELDPLQADALVGLAAAAAERNDHAIAAELYDRLRALGLPQAVAANHELALARSLVALGRTDDARASLRRATFAGGEPAAEAHAMLAEIADATLDRDHAAAELDTAIASLVELAAGTPPEGDRLYTRAAELAVARAMLFDRHGEPLAAGADWQRAHALARQAAPEIARDAARTLLARSGDDANLERRWIDAVLATRPPPSERAALLVRRADVRRRERFPDLAAALADLHEAVELTEEGAESAGETETRRRAYQLEAELFAQSGDQRSRAQSLAAIAKLAERASDRVASEAAAAAAWLEADEPAAALPHGARAHASLASFADVPAALRREVLITLGEAAWRQRAWPDVIRAYHGLLDDLGPEAHRIATFRFRLAVGADRAGDAGLALGALRPLIDDPESIRSASPELRAHALRLFADLAERAGDHDTAAMALEAFASIGGDSSASARADAVYRAGELFRRADRDDDAIRCFETALRIADSHLPALDALEAAWRERGDLERVAVILGRKVAATARHPARQKPLLSRLGDLQDQLRRPEVALATHQRALEIDPMWRPSLRHVTLRLRDSGQVVAAAGGLAQLAGDLHGDHGTDLAIVTRERQIAAEALAELIARLDDAQIDAVRAVALPALERAALDNADVGAGLARLRGEVAAAAPNTPRSEADTQSGRVAAAPGGALSLREAAARARAAGKLDEAFATLETANHVSPGDATVLRELVEIATELRDHTAAVRHLTALALRLSGARRGDALLELADFYYDRLDDTPRGREAMRKAAEAFGSGTRRDATLRLLATEAGTHLAWDVAVESLLAIPAEKRTQADFTSLATGLMRAGRDADALAAVEAATAASRFDDGGELLRMIQLEIQRKIDLARSLEDRAGSAPAHEAAALLDEAQQLRVAIGQPGTHPLRDLAAPDGEAPRSDTAPWPMRTKTRPGVPNRKVQPAAVGSRSRPTLPPPVGGAAGASDPPPSSPAIAVPAAAAAERSDDSIPGIVIPETSQPIRSSPAI